MKDQKQWLYNCEISAVTLISNVVAKDPNIWKRVDKEKYLVVINSLKVLLGLHSFL